MYRWKSIRHFLTVIYGWYICTNILCRSSLEFAIELSVSVCKHAGLRINHHSVDLPTFTIIVGGPRRNSAVVPVLLQSKLFCEKKKCLQAALGGTKKKQGWKICWNWCNYSVLIGTWWLVNRQSSKHWQCWQTFLGVSDDFDCPHCWACVNNC